MGLDNVSKHFRFESPVEIAVNETGLVGTSRLSWTAEIVVNSEGFLDYKINVPDQVIFVEGTVYDEELDAELDASTVVNLRSSALMWNEISENFKPVKVEVLSNICKVFFNNF